VTPHYTHLDGIKKDGMGAVLAVERYHGVAFIAVDAAVFGFNQQ